MKNGCGKYYNTMYVPKIDRADNFESVLVSSGKFARGVPLPVIFVGGWLWGLFLRLFALNAFNNPLPREMPNALWLP